MNWDKLPPGKARQAFVKWAVARKIPLRTAKQMAMRKFGGGSSKSRMIDDYLGNKDPQWQ